MLKKALAVALLVTVIIVALTGAGNPSASSGMVTEKEQGVSTSSPIVNTDNAVIYKMNRNKTYEMRGVWVATVTNIDMPSKMNEDTFKNWAKTVCQNVADRNFNTIVFQVKPTADALYKSALAPWSKYITEAAQGTDPGYDPLEIMLTEAHERGIELHAWINPYRVTMPNEQLSQLAANNPAIKNPSWVIQYNKQYYLNPGIPEVRQYLIDCVAELVANYDIDAVHMDDYFYPYPVDGLSFPDDAQFAKYGAGFSNAADWRRENVNLLVSGIHKKMAEIKPYVPFGISPFGIWRNARTDATGSDTSGLQNYDALYADTRQWIKDGSVDYIVPQIYWSRISTAANFNTLINWWNNELIQYAANRPVNLYIGLADYKVGTNNDVAWEKYGTEIMGQISEIRQKEAISGQMHFSYKNVINNPLIYFDYIKNNLYQHKAVTPSYYWKEAKAASPPLSVTAAKADNGINVSIYNSQGDTTARKYVIYRDDAAVSAVPAEGFDNSLIVGVAYRNGDLTLFTDTNAVKGKNYKYFVAAVAYSGVENPTLVESAIVSY